MDEPAELPVASFEHHVEAAPVEVSHADAVDAKSEHVVSDLGAEDLWGVLAEGHARGEHVDIALALLQRVEGLAGVEATFEVFAPGHVAEDLLGEEVALVVVERSLDVADQVQAGFGAEGDRAVLVLNDDGLVHGLASFARAAADDLAIANVGLVVLDGDAFGRAVDAREEGLVVDDALLRGAAGQIRQHDGPQQDESGSAAWRGRRHGASVFVADLRPAPSARRTWRPLSSSMSENRLALRVVTMPRDTNQYGTIFGGVILSYIDQAGFVEARRHGVHRWVTASIERVDFKAPVHLGDTVNLLTRTVRKGTKSVTVEVSVEAERYESGSCTQVTTATMTMVSVDAEGNPIPFDSPPTVA